MICLMNCRVSCRNIHLKAGISVMQNIQKTDYNSFTKTRVIPGFCFAKIFPLYKYQTNTRGKEKNKNCLKYN